MNSDTVPFSARFEPQDASFSVHPESGILGPVGSQLSDVRLAIRFRPACYGRTRHSKLVVRVRQLSGVFLIVAFICLYFRLETVNVWFMLSRVWDHNMSRLEEVLKLILGTTTIKACKHPPRDLE